MRRFLTKNLVIVFLLVFCNNLYAADYCFYVQLTDKNDSPYSTSDPSAFLSDRAIKRREFFHKPIDETDLPVNPHYISKIKKTGVKIHSQSKWLNGITITTSDSVKIAAIKKFPFVKTIEYTGKIKPCHTNEQEKHDITSKMPEKANEYGEANGQIHQVKATHLHNLGYRGKDIYIGMLDGGFVGTDNLPIYEQMIYEGRLIATKNFAHPEKDIFTQSSHGTEVLSIMALNMPNKFIGTAPEASYILLCTENTDSEFLVETDNWIAGLEFADSLGVDIINSSLGYTTFDDPAMNFTYTDMNGRNNRISRAASMAIHKGIIIVNSAGNDGNKEWKYINAPADAEHIITVGSITSDNQPSSFSSYGPSADGRIKPELVAQGTQTALINNSGNAYNSGTSFSTPIITGTTACFLQAAKTTCQHISIEEICRIIFESASSFDEPTEQMGYGIPDFEKAANKLLDNESYLYMAENYRCFVNSAIKTIRIKTENQANNNIIMQLYSPNGNIAYMQKIDNNELIVSTRNFCPGIYTICVFSENGETNSRKIVLR